MSTEPDLAAVWAAMTPEQQAAAKNDLVKEGVARLCREIEAEHKAAQRDETEEAA